MHRNKRTLLLELYQSQLIWMNLALLDKKPCNITFGYLVLPSAGDENCFPFCGCGRTFLAHFAVAAVALAVDEFPLAHTDGVGTSAAADEHNRAIRVWKWLAEESGQDVVAVEPGAWRGDIDPDDPTRITWQRLDSYPGPPLYRAAGGSHGNRVLFVGGTDNPYNYDGIGYDGVPSEPRDGFFGFDVTGNRWIDLTPLGVATMDHRSVVVADGRLFLAGGMLGGQRVTDRVVTRRLP